MTFVFSTDNTNCSISIESKGYKSYIIGEGLEMKKRIKLIVTKVVALVLALIMFSSIPVKEALAAHSSGGGHAFNDFYVYDYGYSWKDARVYYQNGTSHFFNNYYVTYNEDTSTLYLLEWYDCKELVVIENARLIRTYYLYRMRPE